MKASRWEKKCNHFFQRHCVKYPLAFPTTRELSTLIILSLIISYTSFTLEQCKEARKRSGHDLLLKVQFFIGCLSTTSQERWKSQHLSGSQTVCYRLLEGAQIHFCLFFFLAWRKKKERKKKMQFNPCLHHFKQTSPSRHTVTSLTISGSEPDISIQAINKFWMGSHSGQQHLIAIVGFIIRCQY